MTPTDLQDAITQLEQDLSVAQAIWDEQEAGIELCRQHAIRTLPYPAYRKKVNACDIDKTLLGPRPTEGYDLAILRGRLAREETAA